MRNPVTAAVAGLLLAWLVSFIVFYGLPVEKRSTKELCWLQDHAYPWENQAELVWRCIPYVERTAKNGELNAKKNGE